MSDGRWIDLPARRILVTGSSGFIGSHLATALASSGYAVTGWDIRPPLSIEPGVRYDPVNLLDAGRVRDALGTLAPSAILHLAARTDLDGRTVDEYPANVVGVANLVAAIAATPSVARAVCTSSQLVCRIGYTPKDDQDYAPTTPYGQSKVLTERLWREEIGDRVTWCLVRPTTIWGPRMNPHYLRFFRMIRDGRYFHVGKGPTLKSYGYVGNTVHQYLRLLEAPAPSIDGRVFFLADYDLLSLRDWAEAFRAALGAPPIRTLPVGVARVMARVGDAVNALGMRSFPFNTFRLTNVLTEYRADLTATRAVCGDLPYTVADGVAHTSRWLHTALAGS